MDKRDQKHKARKQRDQNKTKLIGDLVIDRKKQNQIASK